MLEGRQSANNRSNEVQYTHFLQDEEDDNNLAAGESFLAFSLTTFT